MKKVTESVNPTLWSTDGNHLNTKRGEQVFDKEREAVKQIMDVTKNGKESTSVLNSLQNDIDQLVGVDQMLSSVVITDTQNAINGAGTSKIGDAKQDIADAQKEMSKAQDETNKKNYDDAIDHYKNAWKQAEEALGDVSQHNHDNNDDDDDHNGDNDTNDHHDDHNGDNDHH
jgi:hypothetical protein